MARHTQNRTDSCGTNFQRSLLASAIGCALALALPQCVLATTFTVTNTADDGSAGSLRAAVALANADTSPPTVVDFQTGLAGTITLTTGAIAITNAMTIQGPGSSALTVSGGNASRIFTMTNGTSAVMAVTLSGLTMTGGNAGNHLGGAIYAQGANLTVSHSVLSGNSTSATAGTNHGGAIFASNYNGQGTLDIEYSTLSGNSAANSGGAIYGEHLLQSTINQSTLSNNTAGSLGGAVFLNGGSMALTHATISGNRSNNRGGGAALENAAGILTVSNCTFSGNTAVSGGGVYIYHGAPTVSATTISGNTVSGSGGGIYAYHTNLTVTGSTISGNTSAGTTTNTGGGLYALNAAVTIEQSLISGNTAHSGGGLTINNPTDGSATGLVIQSSTISQNTANYGRGGGINLAFDTNYAATLTNDTIVGNTIISPAHPYGGGIYSNAGNGGTGTLTIQSSTIANNSAGYGGGIASNPKAAVIIVHNTIVANNSASSADPDLDGAFLANYDFIRNTTGATLNAGSSNDLTGTDPQLGSLGYYGGPTPTKLPLPGSPVIDAGDPATSTPTYDQRGNPYARVVNGRIDIGADERQASEDTIFLDGFEGY